LKPEWWVHHWLKGRSTREERKPVTRNDDDDDNNNNNNNYYYYYTFASVLTVIQTALSDLFRIYRRLYKEVPSGTNSSIRIFLDVLFLEQTPQFYEVMNNHI
jgi:hypothetical protein